MSPTRLDGYQCEYTGKDPVTPSRASTAMARSCLIFQSAVRSQENPDIFSEKGYSRRPYSVLQ